MEENISDALHIGVSVFMFVAAVSASLLLMQSISNMAELSLESLDSMDKTVIERTTVPPAYVVTGSEIISYYSNYVMPANTNFDFFIDTANTLTATDTEIGYEKDHKPKIDPTPYINRCTQLTKTNAAQFNELSNKLNDYYVKVVRPNGTRTNVYFIAAGTDYARAESFMYCLAQISN